MVKAFYWCIYQEKLAISKLQHHIYKCDILFQLKNQFSLGFEVFDGIKGVFFCSDGENGVTKVKYIRRGLSVG